LWVENPFCYFDINLHLIATAHLHVVEVASLPRQSLRMNIRRLLGAKRLTTSGFSRQSRRQTSLPPVLLLIRSD
jgi:hypothetical protein